MAKNKDTRNDPFSDDNEVQSNWIKWGVPQEDKVFGTLISRRTVKSTFSGKEDEDVTIYELKTDYGSFHATDGKKVAEEPTVVGEGEIWSIGGKAMIDRQMQNIKLGQKIGLKFIEEAPAKTKGFAPAKVIKVFAPKNDAGEYQMDEEWLAQREADKELADFGN